MISACARVCWANLMTCFLVVSARQMDLVSILKMEQSRGTLGPSQPWRHAHEPEEPLVPRAVALLRLGLPKLPSTFEVFLAEICAMF
ncbi:hypothetical protein V8D89_005553, partial [Ganoderma adspersum]